MKSPAPSRGPILFPSVLEPKGRHNVANSLSSPKTLSYILITPAKDEAETISLTIRSVIAQTRLPRRWIIVSDGSTDGTDDIIRSFSSKYPWIDFIRMPERQERHFAGKVNAFKAAYIRIKSLQYDLIGNLDADLSFDDTFFEFLINAFKKNSRLGVAGAPFFEKGKSYDFRFSSIEHVSGACQLFRKQCYIDIGGYVPVVGGGIDVIAVLTARMHGWETQTFTEKHYIHHRKMGTANDHICKARYKDGQKDYSLGAHPIWVAFRSVYQMTKKPLLLGGLLLFSGYVISSIRRRPRVVSEELMHFRRTDQIRRLLAFTKKLAGHQ